MTLRFVRRSISLRWFSKDMKFCLWLMELYIMDTWCIHVHTMTCMSVVFIEKKNVERKFLLPRYYVIVIGFYSRSVIYSSFN